VTAVVLGQIDAIRLVVGRNDHTGHIEHRVLAQEFLIAPKNVRRCRHERFGVVVEAVASDVAEIARFGDAGDHALEISIEGFEQIAGRDL